MRFPEFEQEWLARDVQRLSAKYPEWNGLADLLLNGAPQDWQLRWRTPPKPDGNG